VSPSANTKFYFEILPHHPILVEVTFERYKERERERERERQREKESKGKKRGGK
jgi:hypothetical protein